MRRLELNFFGTAYFESILPFYLNTGGKFLKLSENRSLRDKLWRWFL